MTADSRYDVVGIGNAIVDVIAKADDDFLVARGLHKGSMTLVDEAASAALYDAMGPAAIVSGGSAANTMAAIASLGGRAAFIGKVRDDDAGRAFRHDIQAAGVAFTTRAAVDGAATARCLIVVTPDGERTMSTYLGACVALGPEDVEDELVAASRILYFEGYLWDPPRAKEAFRKAAAAARRSGGRTALTLSDSFCVDRYRDEFLELIRSGLVDILFANESELHALYQTADFDTAIGALRDEKALSFVTRSAAGCVVVENGGTQPVPAASIERLVDTTGAGDLFAAGVLYGLSHGMPTKRCAQIGALAAAEIIQHYGARPEVSLAELVAQSGV